AKLLVLDESTLGLDILYRKQFYDSLLNDYFDRSRTIIVTTHQVEEIQDVLTDLMFINRGQIVLQCSMEEFDSRYVEVMVNPEHVAAARALKPIHERPGFGRSVLPFDHVTRAQLTALGEVRRPSIADLFVAAMMLIFTAFIVGVFYCLDALHSERRDRSILFWKSLPVSDLITVLSKASVPFVILPLIIFGTVVLVQFLMLLWSSAILLPSGLAATTWTRFNLFQQSVILLYSLIVIVLWHAPIYGWALLISGWARRPTFLWAVLPFLAIGVLEKIAFDTSHFASMLKDRVFGAGDTAFAFQPHHGVAIDS